MEEILKKLTNAHYTKEIEFYRFNDSRRTDEKIIMPVASLLDRLSWDNSIAMLCRIQKKCKITDPDIFLTFWKHLLIIEDAKLSDYTDSLRLGLFDFDAYLKSLIVLVTGTQEHVIQLQSRTYNGMKATVDKCRSRSVNLFKGSETIVNIIETIRCYRNGSAHYPLNIQELNSTEEISQDEKLVLQLTNVFSDDSKILDSVARLMLVGLLLIIDKCYDDLEEHVPRLDSASGELSQVFQLQFFLERYFSYLHNEVDGFLVAQAIPMFKGVSESGYLEHTLRFKHGSSETLDEKYDLIEDDNNDEASNKESGDKDIIPQSLNLGQLYLRAKHRTNVLLGMPGAGKSTALRLIISSISKQYIDATEEEREDIIIPVYIKLNEVYLSDGNKDPIGESIRRSITKCIINESENYQAKAIQTLFDLMKKGRVMLLIDGLNEIPAGLEGSTRNLIIGSLTDFMREYLPDVRDEELDSFTGTEGPWTPCKVILTCREYEYERGDYSNKIESVPGGVAVWHLEGFSYEKIEKYLPEDVKTVIERREIENLFISPLNIKLFLEALEVQKASEHDSNITYVPRNRGEIIDNYIESVLTRDKLDIYYANYFLKTLAAESMTGKPDKGSLIDADPQHFTLDLIEKLASYNIISVSPATAEQPEELSFSIDTFHEFFRAKYILDALKKNKDESLASISYKGKKVINLLSEDDYETLKLIVELGSSAKFNTHKDSHFSLRIAIDFIRYCNEANAAKTLLSNGSFNTPHIFGEQYLTLCKLVSDIDVSSSPSVDNAKSIARSFVLNNLRLFRVNHPTPQPINKRGAEYSYLYTLMEAAAYICDEEVFSELFSSYWLLTYCVLNPADWNYTFNCGKIEDYYPLLSVFFLNCKGYCELYDRLHKVHINYILRGKTESAIGIGRLINQFFLCFIPLFGKKLLLNHLLDIDNCSKKVDDQLKADINSLLCYIGDGELLSKEIRYGIKTGLRIREIRYLLRHYSDSQIQKTIFTSRFFDIIEDTTIDLKSFVIRFYLFRLGLTPIIKNFLFDNEYIKRLPQDVARTITDIIPLKTIPRQYAESRYDRDVYDLLLSKSGGASPGESIIYNLYQRGENCAQVAIEDVQEESFVDKKCLIKKGAFRVTEDSCKDTFRLYCEVKSKSTPAILLPKYGSIVSDSGESIKYDSASPDTTLKFYLYGDMALKMCAIYTLHQCTFINDIPCEVVVPELESNPVLVLRRIRVLTLVPCSEYRFIPYSGLLTFEEEIQTSPSLPGSLRVPERFYDLRVNENVKSDSLPYLVFGMDKSNLWIVSEKVVTQPTLLINSEASDVENNNLRYIIKSVMPFNHPYWEIRFSSSRRVVLPKYGVISCVDKDGNSFTIRYCYCLSSEDCLSHLIRIFDERALEDNKSSFKGSTFRYGSVSLFLTSYEIIRPNRKYSIWHLQSNQDIEQTLSSSGQLQVWTEGKNTNETPRQITVSGETRTSIPCVHASLLYYSEMNGEILLSASVPSGKIGAGQGDINLLRGLYLHNQLSSLRILIDKESILDVSWSARLKVSFLTKEVPSVGKLRIGDSALSYVYDLEKGVIRVWAPICSISLDDVISYFKSNSTVEILAGSSVSETYDILPDNSRLISRDECSMLIHSICKNISTSDLLAMRGGEAPKDVEYSIQALSPVCNYLSFPRVFSPLFSKAIIPFVKHNKKEGTIVIPRPVSELQADYAVINNLRWNITEVGLRGDSFLQITLSDRKGSTPKLEQRGTVYFVRVKQTIHLWYKHLFNLIEPSQPERYHSELCDTLLEEIRLGYTDIEEGLVNLFIAKSRASDLAFNKSIVNKIESKLPYHRFNVCRVTGSSVGIDVYSPLRKTELRSSDTEPASHDGRAFQWADLVLFEENHRVSLVDDSYRYRSMGFKEGYVITIDSLEAYGDRKQLSIYCPEDNFYYMFYYSASRLQNEFRPGDYVSFYATINYNDGQKLSAERVQLKQCEESPINAELVKKESLEQYLVFTFLVETREIVLKVGKRVPTASKLETLQVGRSYKLIRGRGTRYIIAF